MRWRAKLNFGPRLGDLRIRRHFAFFPVRVGGFLVWLGHFYRVERCFHIYGGFLGAKWAGEYLGFEKEDCFHFLSSGHGPLVFLERRKLFRIQSDSESVSPWYLDNPF